MRYQESEAGSQNPTWVERCVKKTQKHFGAGFNVSHNNKVSFKKKLHKKVADISKSDDVEA
jgi:hypothetical protein